MCVALLDFLRQAHFFFRRNHFYFADFIEVGVEHGLAKCDGITDFELSHSMLNFDGLIKMDFSEESVLLRSPELDTIDVWAHC